MNVASEEQIYSSIHSGARRNNEDEPLIYTRFLSRLFKERELLQF